MWGAPSRAKKGGAARSGAVIALDNNEIVSLLHELFVCHLVFKGLTGLIELIGPDVFIGTFF